MHSQPATSKIAWLLTPILWCGKLAELIFIFINVFLYFQMTKYLYFISAIPVFCILFKYIWWASTSKIFFDVFVPMPGATAAVHIHFIINSEHNCWTHAADCWWSDGLFQYIHVMWSSWHFLHVNMFYTFCVVLCVAVLCLMSGLRVMLICVDAHGHVV